MKALKHALYILISVTVMLATLTLISYILSDKTILPYPSDVFNEIFRLFSRSAFYKEIAINLWRTAYSFVFSLILGSALAVLAGCFTPAEKLLYPFVATVRSVPTIAVILWCLMIFNTDKSPAAISFIVMFPMIYSAVLSAIKTRDKSLDEMAFIYGIKRKDKIFKILIPDVIGKSFNQICSLFSFNVKLIVAGEALAYTRLSLGRELQIANANTDTAKLLAVTVVVIILSILAESLLRSIGELIKRAIYGYNRKRIIQKLRG